MDVILSHYDALHEHNVNFFSDMRAKFFEGIMAEYFRRNALADKFSGEVRFWIFHAISEIGVPSRNDQLHIDALLDTQKDGVAVNISSDDERMLGVGKEWIENILNDNSRLKERVGNALSSIYKYKGDFVFTISDYIPF